MERRGQPARAQRSDRTDEQPARRDAGGIVDRLLGFTPRDGGFSRVGWRDEKLIRKFMKEPKKEV